MTETTQPTEIHAVVEAIRSHDRFLVVTHENPDGDALGSLLATTLALRDAGKDTGMYLAGDAPLPAEYRFLDLSELQRGAPPEDTEERVLRHQVIDDDRGLGRTPLGVLRHRC